MERLIEFVTGNPLHTREQERLAKLTKEAARAGEKAEKLLGDAGNLIK